MTVRVALLSKEYPPEVYGGAGVHVEYLARELAHLVNVDVHCFGGDRPDRGAAPRVFAYRSWDRLAGPAPHLAALQAMAVDLAIAAGVQGADIVHSHTWYANFAGHVAKLIYEVPHVCTVHSLEPMRPWKADQLGGGYRLSTFCEQTALEHADGVIAVSSAVRDDVLRCYPAVEADRVHVVHNGIDPVEWHPDNGVEALKRHGVDPSAPTVIFVGRVTRQKGIQYLLEAAALLDPSVQIVLRAGSPDTPELGHELTRQVSALRARRSNVVWIEDMLERWEVIQLLTHAEVFCCPSIYEPLGLVNLEAMACETAVVASAVGGIPEVVAHGETGLLVPFEPIGADDPSPADPEAYAAALAAALEAVLGDRVLRTSMGQAGRQRVIDHFSWSAIAHRTIDLYESVGAGQAEPLH
jgi:starch synthase